MSAPVKTTINNRQNWGYKVTSRELNVGQLVNEAEGEERNLPYYIYEFGEGTRRFVRFDVDTYK